MPLPDAPISIEDDDPPELIVEPDHPIAKHLEKFVELAENKRELNRQLKSVQAAVDRLEPVLLEYFQSNRIRNIRSQSSTVWLREELWARPKYTNDRPRVCEILKQVGLGHFVEPDFNTPTLSGYVRELQRANLDRIRSGEIDSVADLLPPALAAVLNVAPSFKVLGRRKS
jgi:hypothetical protein